MKETASLSLTSDQPPPISLFNPCTTGHRCWSGHWIPMAFHL